MADAWDVPKNVPAAGENWTMPTCTPGLNAAITEPSVFLGLRIKVSALLAEPDVNGGGTVPLIRCESS